MCRQDLQICYYIETRSSSTNPVKGMGLAACVKDVKYNDNEAELH